ncbi:MAG TPA: outer membrane beta-barrel protein [Candidatus Saccharimonadales bacterium]|nr:outer membrane beta-barrel protein [Candidatus Saccharimonadales bacterium]
MKINQWTLGLAAVGLVSLSPALLAQTAPQSTPLLTALSATTISGYVDTSAVWNPGTGTANVAPYSFNAGKQNGFNLDQVVLDLSKPIEEGKWSAGYNFELSYGPDATAIDAGAYPIRQAYVDLGIPVGNGLELKLGRFDQLLGYETSDSVNNPNWTRSYGYSLEPTEQTGLLANYKFADWVSLQGGVVDEVSTIGGVNARYESRRGVTGLLTLTAPDSWGWVKGSALYGGIDYGPGAASDMTEWYLGLTLNTPITGLTLGGSWDNISDADVGGIDGGSFDAFAGYVSYKITDKATVNGRVEYANGSALSLLESEVNGVPFGTLDKVLAVTGTFQYDLWANVVSRLEVRWDHNAGGIGPAFGGEVPGVATKNNEVLIAANVIYKF